MVYSLVLAITPKNQQTINRSYQRKLGSNTSELRMAFTWWNWPWWRVVHHITIHNKGIRSYDTGWWRREVVTKGSGDEVKWWWRDDDGKWWRWEVVRKASGDEGKWWGREVVMKGSGDDGKWWRRECGERREVVRKGGGDEGKWWRWEVVTKRVWWTKGSGEDGKLWRREVVTMGSGDEGKWWWRECCKMHCNGCMNVACSVLLGGSRSTKSCVFRVKWLQLAMKGTSCVQRVRLGSLGSFYMCFATNGCSCVRSSMRFLEGVVADRIGMAAWMLHALCCWEEAGARQRVVVPVCVVLCVSWNCPCRSHWNGCVKVACCRGCMRNTIVFCSCIS